MEVDPSSFRAFGSMEHLRDPRDNGKRMSKRRGQKGKNTDSFDPASTHLRPAMRVRTHLDTAHPPCKPLSHDDVLIVPNFVERPDELMSAMLEQMTAAQRANVDDSQFISWHEGAHLIVKNADCSDAFRDVMTKLCDYFHIDRATAAYRFNLYKDDEDWKAYVRATAPAPPAVSPRLRALTLTPHPRSFHHDSAAFNPSRARRQNITVGLSLGCERELAFKHASAGNDTLVYFPQPSGTVFSFGKAVNIRWMHGINAIPAEKRSGEPRVSIIVWGLTSLTVDEPDEPSILVNNDRRPQKKKDAAKHRPDHRRQLADRDLNSAACADGDRLRTVKIVPQRERNLQTRHES